MLRVSCPTELVTRSQEPCEADGRVKSRLSENGIMVPWPYVVVQRFHNLCNGFTCV